MPPASYTWTVEALPTCQVFTVTTPANADAWIDQGSRSSNKGTDSTLKVQGKSNTNYRSLVQFPLPQAPQGCVVQSATLRLYAASFQNGRTLQARQITGSWAENGVTWNNQPGQRAGGHDDFGQWLAFVERDNARAVHVRHRSKLRLPGPRRQRERRGRRAAVP
jgi:hypothetical protein